MKKNLLSLAVTSLILAISSCSPTPNPHFKVGAPYKIDGKQYIPGIDANYSEVGEASWYGSKFHNKLTANGEIFNKGDMTAAHRTLPLPSVVTVTNLENNKTVKLRVNDRGPFAKDRIIDVSEEAAEQLGFHRQGTTKVLVKLLKNESISALDGVKMKPEQKETLLAAYNQPNAIIATKSYIKSPVSSTTANNNITYSSKLPKSMQRTTVKPVQENRSREVLKSTSPNNAEPIDSKNYFVQLASFSSIDNAKNFAKKVDSNDIKIIKSNVSGKILYRVKAGEYNSESDANLKLSELKNKGFNKAFITK